MKGAIISLLQNPYFSMILSLITIASLAYAIYVNATNKKYKFFEHCELSKTLLFPGDTKNPDLHLYYQDNEISNATITNVAIWNAGNEAIRNSDLGNSLTLYFDDKIDVENNDLEYVNSVLDVSILGFTNQKSNIRIVEKDNNKLSFDFKYMNPNDGFVVQLLHTGYPFNLRVDADVIGENKKRLRVLYKRKHRMQSDVYDFLRRFLKKYSVLLCALVTLIFLLWITARKFYPSILGSNQLDIKVTTIMLVVLLIVSWAFVILLRKADVYDYVPAEIRELLDK